MTDKKIQKKECKKEQILNPITNRCVQINGTTAKEIIDKHLTNQLKLDALDLQKINDFDSSLLQKKDKKKEKAEAESKATSKATSKTESSDKSESKATSKAESEAASEAEESSSDEDEKPKKSKKGKKPPKFKKTKEYKALLKKYAALNLKIKDLKVDLEHKKEYNEVKAIIIKYIFFIIIRINLSMFIQ